MSHGSHSHGAHASRANRSRLMLVMAIVAAVLVLEIVGAWLSGSLALLADAGHVLSDLTGLTVALIATIIAAQPPTDRHTYGYRRAEVFGALLNGCILLLVAGFVSVEAIRRLTDPAGSAIEATPLLVVAVIGAIANLAALLILRGSAKESINMRGAYLEVFADMVGSVAVIVAAVVIVLTGFQAADAIASLFIALIILPRAFTLLRDVFRVLSESVPHGTDVELIRQHILENEGVVDIHDVHVWAITSGSHVFSAHVLVDPEVFVKSQTGPLLERLNQCLQGHFDVEHSTFQLEPFNQSEHGTNTHR